MEDFILLSQLNDFIFCPVSIYFHNIYGETEKTLYQRTAQISGTKSHETVDHKKYSTSKHIITSLEVFCEEYKLVGKLDIFNTANGILTERKKNVKCIYDGYIFQLYGQYFALKEMGYNVKKLIIHSMDDNANYNIPLPEENPEMYAKFEQTIIDIRNFDINSFMQSNPLKCQNCIYEPICDRSFT